MAGSLKRPGLRLSVTTFAPGAGGSGRCAPAWAANAARAKTMALPAAERPSLVVKEYYLGMAVSGVRVRRYGTDASRRHDVKHQLDGKAQQKIGGHCAATVRGEVGVCDERLIKVGLSVRGGRSGRIDLIDRSRHGSGTGGVQLADDVRDQVFRRPLRTRR